MAINFTNSINDKELWDFLLDYSMSKPDFINALLVSAGDWIDRSKTKTKLSEKKCTIQSTHKIPFK